MPFPGVTVTTTVRSGPAGTVRAPSGQWFVVGQFERGPLDRPVQVRSMAEFIRVFGGDTSYADGYSQVNTFFNEGGAQAQVMRVAGGSAAKGFLVLQDRATTPAPTVRIEASSAGSWSSNLTVQVANGPAANTYRITVRYNGAVVEDYNGLATPADAVTALSTSSYVRASIVAGNTTTAPNNIPAVLAATAASAGTDDRTNVTADSYIAGLNKFDASLGDGSVSIPGQTTTAIYNALRDHAVATNRVALLAAAVDATTSALQTAATSVNSEYVGLFAPWVIVPSASGNRTISPEGYVAGVRARAHEAIGPWRTPAGTFATANFVVGVNTVYGLTDLDTLYSSKVSVIRGDGNSIRLYGWRTLSNDQRNWFSLKDRDTLNRITVESYNRLEQYIFMPIDTKGQLLSDIEAELVGIVAPIALANGLYGQYNEDGTEIDPGYSVSVNSELNTPETLARNEIHANLAVRVAPSGDFITLAIVKVGLLDSLV